MPDVAIALQEQLPQIGRQPPSETVLRVNQARHLRRAPELCPNDPDADILLVPTHPRTGQTWTPAGPACPVPLPFGVWQWLTQPALTMRRPRAVPVRAR